MNTVQTLVMQQLHKDWVKMTDIQRRTSGVRVASLYERLSTTNRTIVNNIFIELTGYSLEYFVDLADNNNKQALKEKHGNG